MNLPEDRKAELHGWTIFCDDLREEKQRTFTYVGVHRGTVAVESFPAVIAKFAVSITVRQGVEVAGKSLTLRIDYKGKDGTIKEIMQQEHPLNVEDLKKATGAGDLVTAVADIVFSPLSLDGPGQMIVQASNGIDTIRVGSCTFRARKAAGDEAVVG